VLPYVKAGDREWSDYDALPTVATKGEAVRRFWEVMTPVIGTALAQGWDPQVDLQYLGIRGAMSEEQEGRGDDSK
jgi:hypothetical protein